MKGLNLSVFFKPSQERMTIMSQELELIWENVVAGVVPRGELQPEPDPGLTV